MRFRNSVRALYAAVAVLAVTLVLGIYVDLENGATQIRRLELSTQLEKMQRLSEELSDMILMAVLDQNFLRTSSYDTVNADLHTTLVTVQHLAGALRSSQEVRVLAASRDARGAIEERVLDAVRAEDWPRARQEAFSESYGLTKKTNEIDSQTAVGAVLGELSATAELFDRIETAATGLRIAAFLLLLWVGLAFSRRARLDLDEQVRLRSEVSAANSALEERVRQRTADLEERTLQAAREGEERRRTEARTRLILHSAGEGILGVDSEERVTFLNRAAERLLGYSGSELIGKGVHETIHHSHADGGAYPRDRCPMVRVSAGGQEEHIDNEVLWRRDGSSFSSEYSVVPIIDEGGAAVGAVVVFRDVTAQRRNAVELNQRLEELERFNTLTVSREERMIELKREINAALQELGREGRYKIVQ